MCYGCGPTGCSSTWQRRTFCRVCRLVGSIRSRMNHWEWARTLFSLSALFKIWVSILTQTCGWTHTSHELFPAVLLFCDKYAASVDPSVNPSCSRSFCRSLFHSTTMLVRRWPDFLYVRLKSVLNAVARLIYRCRKFDHLTPLLHDIHWLRILERITFRLAVLAYRCQNGLALQYLAVDVHQVAVAESRRRLRSAATASLIVPAAARSTIGDCAFSVAGARAWNSLNLGDVINVPSSFLWRRVLTLSC